MTNCLFPPGYFVDGDGRKSDIPCKSWRCPSCARVMKNRLMDRVAQGFAGDRVRFLTLTVKAGAPDEDIMKYWNRFKSALYYRGYRNFKYFIVKEFTRRGVRHLHIAMSAYIPKTLIDKYWYLATEKTSFITYITYEHDIKNIAGYLTKYMTKSIYSGGFNKGERRYAFSRHQAFKLARAWEKPMTRPGVILDQHFNPASKYWTDELYNPMMAAAGIHAISYFETATLDKTGLPFAIVRHPDYDEPLTMEECQILVWAMLTGQEPGEVDRYWRIYRKRFLKQHNRI